MTEPVEPTEHTESTEPVETTEPIESIDQVQPAETKLEKKGSFNPYAEALKEAEANAEVYPVEASSVIKDLFGFSQ